MTAAQPLVRVQSSVQAVWFDSAPHLFSSSPYFWPITFCFGFPAIGPDGLCCQSREFKEWHGCRSTKGVTKGLCWLDLSSPKSLDYWCRELFFILFSFICREILLWGGLSRPRSVSRWLVHQPGSLGLGWVLLLFQTAGQTTGHQNTMTLCVHLLFRNW